MSRITRMEDRKPGVRYAERKYPRAEVVTYGDFDPPELDIENPHETLVALWESLTVSGQAKYYEPSDYEYARVLCTLLNAQLHSVKPNAQLTVALIERLSKALLLSEGDRRLLNVEVERVRKPKAEVVTLKSRLSDQLKAAAKKSAV